MDKTIQISPNDTINTEVLNNKINKLYTYLNSITPATLIGNYATTTTSGSVTYSDTTNTTAISSAISPYTLHNTPQILNTYFNNTISPSVSYLDATMQYIILSNKIVLMFGKINTIHTTSSINFNQLFQLTPYTLNAIYFINIGGNETPPTMGLLPVIKWLTTANVEIRSDLTYSQPISSGVIRSLDWFAIGKIN
jgi:hypothetical protein